MLLVAAVILGAAIGFFAARQFGGLDYTYDFGDCIKKCDALPQIADLRTERDACMAAVPGPNLTVCQHVPPNNQAACIERELKLYNEKTKPCRDAYDLGIDKLNDCTSECKKLIIDRFARK
ncbi:MAG: hypothetical protein IPN97_05180 [Saprospiraceae bacterium]|nr:hypothetical protein [Saprospiraceae bacterium]